MKNPLINYQERVSDNNIDGEMLLSEVLALIKNGSPLTDKLINKARKYGKGTPEYDEIKKNRLPAFLFNFNFEKKLATNNITKGTGLLYMDIDNIQSAFQLAILQEEIKQMPYVLACWKSLSETGLSILVSVKGMNSGNFRLFKTYFQCWYRYNAETGNGLNLDTNAWKPIQKTALSKDEDIYINYGCKTLSYQETLAAFFYEKLNTRKKKAQFTLLKERKENIGELTALSPNPAQIKYSAGRLFYTLTDKQKYANMDEPFTVYPNGVPYNKIFLNKSRKIKEGKRATTLFSMACKYIRMHGEHYTNTLNFLRFVRKDYCENPKSITNALLKQIVKNALQNYTSGKIKMDLGKIIFPKNSLLTTKEKQSINGKEMAKIRSDKTLNLLTELYKPGMAQKELIRLSGMSRRTVQAYWNEDDERNIYFTKPTPKPKSRSQ